MTILLTGGTGKSALGVANLLHKANINQPILLASRSGTAPEPFQGVQFDWLDAATHKNPFEVANDSIERIYLLPPRGVLDCFPSMKAFIDLAISKGAKRFVLMSATLLEPGGQSTGKVHEYLISLGVDYCVLRPTWFFRM